MTRCPLRRILAGVVASVLLGAGCGGGAESPADVAQGYAVAFWENDYEAMYELLAASELDGRGKSEWVADQRAADERARRAGGDPSPKDVTDVQVQLNGEVGGGRQYLAVVTFADGGTREMTIDLVQTDEGWRVIR